MTPKRESVRTMEKALLGGGCFWCIEAIYNRVEGVQSALSGYAGGARKNPSYEQVCRDTTGHAEVVQIEYDPSKISYEELLAIFWENHDPTQVNRQGPDLGTQYRSVIFYHNEQQKKDALASKDKIEKSGKYKKKIATAIVPAMEFYKAEEYHQQYIEKGGKCALG